MPIRFDEFEFDEGRRQLLRNGEALHVPAKQFLLLQLLIERRPNAIAKRELYDRLWPSTYVSDVNLPGLIAELRTTLGDNAREPRYIRTVHGFGYAFCGNGGSLSSVDTDVALATLVGPRTTVRISAGETILGRTTIDDPSVSRRHAAIVCKDNTFTIHDLGSKNGTTLGGTRVNDTPRELHDGDIVTLGSARLVFHRVAPTSTVTLG